MRHLQTRSFATLSRVRSDIIPYLTRRFLHPSRIEERNIPLVTTLLTEKYCNVKTFSSTSIDKVTYHIVVNGILDGGALTYTVIRNGTPLKPDDDTSWIDCLEAYDALMSD